MGIGSIRHSPNQPIKYNNKFKQGAFMLKKMLMSALLLLSAVGFAQDKYEVVLLGDLHYAAEEIGRAHV